MIKYTKSYVMKKYELSIKCEEVEDRDPSKILDDHYMLFFSFYDISYIEDEGKIYQTEKYNYSGRVYFGTKYSIEEFEKKYGSIWPHLVKAYKEENCNSICLLLNSDICVSLGENDVTYDEVLEKKGKQKKK